MARAHARATEPVLKAGQIHWNAEYRPAAEKCTVCGREDTLFDPCAEHFEIGKKIAPAIEQFCRDLRKIRETAAMQAA